jgi:hypothetical protein
MAGKLITIAEFDDFMEASLAKQALESEGIVAVVVGEKFSALYPGMSFAPILLQVNESDEAAAIEILKDFENPPDIIDQYEGGFDDADEEEE